MKKPYEVFILGEDDTQVQLKQILERHGYRVRLDSEQESAIQKIRDGAPDLILLDIKTSDMDGIETCRILKADDVCANIPVVFICTSGMKADKVKGLEAGGLDYIAKPFEDAEVLARIYTYLRMRELTQNLEQEVQNRTKLLSMENQQLKQALKEHKRIGRENIKARNSLLQEKKRLLAVMEALPAGVAVLDAEGRIVIANEAYDKIWGKSRPSVNSIKDAAQYKAWWMDTDKRLQAEDWASSQVIKKGEAVIGQLIEIERFDRSHAFIVNSSVPIFNEQNEVSGCAVALMDISEQKRLEMDKMALESKYRQLHKAESLKRMAAAIAHKFNNLMQAALSNLEVSLLDLSRGGVNRKNLCGAMKAVTLAAETGSLMLEQEVSLNFFGLSPKMRP